MSPQGSGSVLPAGSVAPAASLPEGENVVTVDHIEEDGGLVNCVYPDGFAYSHGAADVSELLTKVTGQLKGRYGWSEVTFVSVPADIEPGATITVSR